MTITLDLHVYHGDQEDPARVVASYHGSPESPPPNCGFQFQYFPRGRDGDNMPLPPIFYMLYVTYDSTDWVWNVEREIWECVYTFDPPPDTDPKSWLFTVFIESTEDPTRATDQASQYVFWD